MTTQELAIAKELRAKALRMMADASELPDEFLPVIGALDQLKRALDEGILALPWKVLDPGHVTTSNGKTFFAGELSEQIIQACNAHYDLIDALRGIREVLPLLKHSSPHQVNKIIALIDEALEKVESPFLVDADFDEVTE